MVKDRHVNMLLYNLDSMVLVWLSLGLLLVFMRLIWRLVLISLCPVWRRVRLWIFDWFADMMGWWYYKQKQGVLPLWFVDKNDYTRISAMDTVSTIGLDALLSGKDSQIKLKVTKANTGEVFEVETKHTMSKDQLMWLKYGSALNYIADMKKNVWGRERGEVDCDWLIGRGCSFVYVYDVLVCKCGGSLGGGGQSQQRKCHAVSSSSRWNGPNHI